MMPDNRPLKKAALDWVTNQNRLAPWRDLTKIRLQLGATTLSIMTFSIETLSRKGLYATLSINDMEHKNTLPSYRLSLCWVTRFIDWVSLCWMSLSWVLWRLPLSWLVRSLYYIGGTGDLPFLLVKWVGLQFIIWWIDWQPNLLKVLSEIHSL